jgi:hypothetical protein
LYPNKCLDKTQVPLYYSINDKEKKVKIYTSTKKIPALAEKPLTERMALLEEAAKKMSVPEKTLLNMLKLLVLVPAFALILQVTDNWFSLAWAGLILLLYPILVKPIQYSLCAKYLKANNVKDSD